MFCILWRFALCLFYLGFVFFSKVFFALLHVLTNQIQVQVHQLILGSQGIKTQMNKVWVKEVDSRSCPCPHKKSHNTGRCSNLFFFPPQLFPHFILLWYAPFPPLGILLSKLSWQDNHWRSLLSEFNFLCDYIIWFILWFEFQNK